MKLTPGTRVVITGASRGIGAALARQLATRGCELGLVARGEEGLRKLVGSLPGDGHRALVADVSDRDSIGAAIAEFGDIDVVVANAGIAHYGKWQDLDEQLEDQMTEINWLGTLHTVRAALPSMIERHHGHVVIVSSGAALRTFPGAAVYGATKSAQRGFAEGLWHDLDRTGVGVTVVYPGEVGTSLHDHQREKLPTWRQGQEADVDECAAAIVTGIEADKRGVYFPPQVRLLQAVHGLSPRLADVILRRLRGASAAPRSR
ncbi:MAG TPA: SDR family NAD(P)-dependent oxidoreductase [Thermoleophilaceae bacterium]|nr:SDR family NAD(P)-dependent oxidoreductase [Thermoleophilaceae bacterium]